MKTRPKKTKRSTPATATKRHAPSGNGHAQQREEKAARHAKPQPAAERAAVRGHWVTKDELALVQGRLQEAQETLDAIRNGEVDAVVVAGPHGTQVYSLSSVEQPYRVFVERMQEGAVTASAAGLILYCNQRFAEMVKMPLERVMGSRAADYLPAQAVKAVTSVLSSGNDAVKHECALHCADGTALPVHLSASALPLADQTVLCLVVTDLTNQRSQEEMRLAKEVAERANIAKDSFLAALSHELRTPLTPVLMALGALERDDEVPAFVRGDLAMIRRNIELETRLIDDLLDLTRIAHGKLTLETAPLDLHAMLTRAVEICRASIDAKQQHLTLCLKAKHTHTLGDAVRLQQVVWNLIRNAIKFTPVGGEITVSSADVKGQGAPGGKVQFEVKDTGIGFQPGAEQKLFLPFEQSDRDITRRFGGLGLGLAISRSIIEAHGGSIRGHSAGQGQGATFVVTLPLVESASKNRGAAKAPAPSAARTGKDILIVEDHADTRETLQRLLARCGHRVTPASSGQHALAIARDAHFDLVISDLGLPDMTGNELMSQLRDRHQLTGIAVSGYGMESDIAQSRDSGFLHHLTKPIQFDELKALIAGAER